MHISGNWTARILTSRLLFVPAALAMAIMTGCATTYTAYKDASVSPSQVAIIKGETERGGMWVGKTVYILEVDGQNVYGWWHFGDPSTLREVRVLAGKHDLKVRYVFARTVVDGKLQLETEAGKTYTIKDNERGSQVVFWFAVDAGKKAETK